MENCVEYRVEGMSCQSCVKKIQEAFADIGVVKVDLDLGLVKVDKSMPGSPVEWKAKIEALGFQVQGMQVK